ncbi:hypothetical protein BJY04DRAFT_230589 [Aspergillus karnatakaensis]|uniref:uncharacterized protein n=1 Tax=Aspergillus karnatakaensis TaxID=1810916 RepID=UPI003CCCF7C6
MTDVETLPDVHGEPPAWAQDRSTLGATLPWFTSRQAGMTHKDKVCWGFLVDGDSGVRSYIDDETVITRLGGGSGKNDDGVTVTVRDQDYKDPPHQSIVNTMKLNFPIGIVIGSRYRQLNRNLPHRFNVMAHFRIAGLWCEKVGGHKAYKVRFEKLNLSEKSWWAVKGSPEPVPHEQRNFVYDEDYPCITCGVSSKKVYDQGWMCLNGECKDFWLLDGNEPPAELTYYQKFLDLRLPPDPYCQPHHSLVPDLLSTYDPTDGRFPTSLVALSGVVCPNCRKCIARRLWDGWVCRDPDPRLDDDPENQCSFKHQVTMYEVSLRSVIDDQELGPIKQALPFDPHFVPKVGRTIDDASLYPYRKITYDFGEQGTTFHFVANSGINARPGGPNDIFVELQKEHEKLDLQRPLAIQHHAHDSTAVGGTLNGQYAANFGMPYKFVVSVDCHDFKSAPHAILRVLGRLQWATNQAGLSLGTEVYKPNELLALGYLPNQAIGYHDDGENTLGPTIASLSLGAPSVMTLRMKIKYYVGFTLVGTKKIKKLLANDPILPGCYNYETRRILKDNLDKQLKELNEERQKPGSDQQNLTLKEAQIREQYEKDWLAAYNAEPHRGFPPTMVGMRLGHGDMMVMHGTGLQKYYEHAAELKGSGVMRFALTARHVLRDRISQDEWHKGDYEETPDMIYDGQ